MEFFEDLLETFLHIVELGRDLLHPGALKEWHRIDAPEQERILRLPTPASAGCYPYHHDLGADQIISEDAFR